MKKIYIGILTSLAFATALNSAKNDYYVEEHWATGYYRAFNDQRSSGEQEVYYYNDEYRWYCHVQNTTQLKTVSAQEYVRVVGDLQPILGLAQSLNECPWMDGFYKTGESDKIYRLYPGTACEITSPEMLAAYGAADLVVTAEAGSDFTAHRTDIGQCYWPQ